MEKKDTRNRADLPVNKAWRFYVTGKGDVEHAKDTASEVLKTLHEKEHSLSYAEFVIEGATAAESASYPLHVLLGGLGAKPDRRGTYNGEEENGWVWDHSNQVWGDPNDAGVDEEYRDENDRGADRGTDRGVDRSTGRDVDRGVEHAEERGTDRNDLGVERGPDTGVTDTADTTDTSTTSRSGRSRGR